MFCNKCGTKLNDDMLFCPKCGAKTNAAKNQNQTQTSPSQAQTTAPKNLKKKKSSKTLVVAIVTLSVVVVVCVVLIVCFANNVFTPKQETKVEQTSSNSSSDSSKNQKDSDDKALKQKMEEEKNNGHTILTGTFRYMKLGDLKKMVNGSAGSNSLNDEYVSAFVLDEPTQITGTGELVEGGQQESELCKMIGPGEGTATTDWKKYDGKHCIIAVGPISYTTYSLAAGGPRALTTYCNIIKEY